ncbi:unnamed protein product, partial [Porites evermanni]
STDSAGFSLSALVTLMTPTEATVKEGIMYLGLCIPDERFVAPYFWSLPSIAYSDFDHLRRTLLRNLKYDTRSQATCLYIIAAYHLTEQFCNVEFGTPEQIQMSVSTGITIFRLWRRYLELKKMRLHALPNASKIKKNRGHFLTYG